MEFRVLGHLQVLRDGQPAHLDTAHKPRLLLAMLLANIGQPLTLDELVEALWIENPPSSARRNIHQYIHRLRSNLGASILTAPGGYQISADTSVDSLDFVRLRSEGIAALAANDLASASEFFRAALGLWRGDAFAGFRDRPLIAVAASKLDRARLAASEQLADIEIRRGNAHSVVEMLAELAEANPYQESLRALWMRSLHASGRQAEALEVFHQIRSTLVEHLGVEPSDELRALHKAILMGDDLDTPGPGTPAIPRELPAVVTSFTGRQKALMELESILSRELDRPVRPVVISAISGMAGIGKTALAVFWGHSVADKFPDGQIYINLRGYADSEPITTMAALSALLGSLGLRPEQIPIDVSEAAARYRTMLAERRILIVLDNARSVEQVRPLLPGTPGCLALITSRDRLTALVAQDGAQRLVLDSLSTTEAVGLLRNLLGREMVASEPDAAEELATICAGLPLALRIAAAQLADNPHGSLSSYVRALRAQNIATSLSAGASGVKTAFESSYRALPPLAQLAFRRLGLVPLKDFTAETTAQLCDLDESTAAEALDRLASAHLAERHQPGRYAIHDLLREYAATLGECEDSDVDRVQATQRLFDWCVASVHAAAEQFYPDFVRAPIPQYGFKTRSFNGISARDWLDAERQNLVSVIRCSSRLRLCETTWMLVDGLRGYYDQQRHVAEYIDLSRHAIAASRFTQNQQGQAASLIALAQACYGAARYRSCIAYLRRGAELSARANWATGEAASSANLALTLHISGQSLEAIECLQRSIQVYRQIGHPGGEAKCLNLLATIYGEQGRLRDGVVTAQRSGMLYRDLGSHFGTGQTFHTLGELYQELGLYKEARLQLQMAVEVHQRLNKPARVAAAKVNLARIELDLHSTAAAREIATSALKLAVELGENLLHVRALTALAAVATADKSSSQSIELYERALGIAVGMKTLVAVVDIHLGLAEVYCAKSMHRKARQHSDEAARIGAAAGYQVRKGKALLLKARIHYETGDYPSAQPLAQQALDIQRATGHQPGVAAAEALLAKLRQGAQKAKATG